MATTYTTTGSVRGNCGHTHRTLSGACKCLASDRGGCERRGGYSDREIVASDGRDLVEDEGPGGKPCYYLRDDE